MGEKELAKALLLGGEVLDVDKLPIGEVTLKNMEVLPMYAQVYDPYSEPERRMTVTMEIIFTGTEEELRGIQYAKKVSIVPR